MTLISNIARFVGKISVHCHCFSNSLIRVVLHVKETQGPHFTIQNSGLFIPHLAFAVL